MARVSLEIPKKFDFSTEIPVRISDVNYGGHLGNDSILSLLQEARVQYLRQHGYTEKNIEGVGIIMVDSVVLYKSEAFHGDVLKIGVAVNDLQGRGCDFVYIITQKESGKEVARAKTGVVFFDYERHKIAEVPPKFRFFFASNT